MIIKAESSFYYTFNTCSLNTETDGESQTTLTAAKLIPAVSGHNSPPLGKILRTFPDLVDHMECINNLIQVVIDALDHPSMS
jgi:hypothetical protein